jgi:hypothetical protein
VQYNIPIFQIMKVQTFCRFYTFRHTMLVSKALKLWRS